MSHTGWVFRVCLIALWRAGLTWPRMWNQAVHQRPAEGWGLDAFIPKSPLCTHMPRQKAIIIWIHVSKVLCANRLSTLMCSLWHRWKMMMVVFLAYHLYYKSCLPIIILPTFVDSSTSVLIWKKTCINQCIYRLYRLRAVRNPFFTLSCPAKASIAAKFSAGQDVARTDIGRQQIMGLDGEPTTSYQLDWYRSI